MFASAALFCLVVVVVFVLVCVGLCRFMSSVASYSLEIGLYLLVVAECGFITGFCVFDSRFCAGVK